MNRIFTIIKREYTSKVCKKSFFVLTIVGPLMILLLIFLPSLLRENATQSYDILVVDNTKPTIIEGDTVSFFENKFTNNEKVRFLYGKDIVKAQQELKDNKYSGVLEIASTNDEPHIKAFLYYSEDEPSIEAKEYIQSQCKDVFKNSVLRVNYSMNNEDIKAINDPQVGFYSQDIMTGEESYSEDKLILGMVLGIMIYFFIFFFGGLIMRSVSEEKTSRIVEVLVSSVKSVYLLFGKIIAVALVGLTQLGLWIVLTLILLVGIKISAPDMFESTSQQEIVVNRVVTAEDINNVKVDTSYQQQASDIVSSINLPLVIGMFVVYFLLGYLLYGALFGAVGSLVDNDSDAGQFSLPITVPLLLAIICLPMVAENPSGAVSFWLSIIPFTSPVIMLIRIPFGVPVWEVILSCGLLIITVIACMYVSAKIYRAGILTYGKQITYKDLFKWLKVKKD